MVSNSKKCKSLCEWTNFETIVLPIWHVTLVNGALSPQIFGKRHNINAEKIVRKTESINIKIILKNRIFKF